MKFLQSIWVLALVGMVLNILTTGFVIYRHKEEFLAAGLNNNEAALDGRTYFWDFRTREIETLVAHLKTEDANLRKRKATLLEIEARAKAETEELNILRKEIIAYRDELSDLIVQIEDSEAKNLKSLATTYTNISPQAAVSILSRMDDTLVVKILSLMKPDGVGPIFEQMASTEGESGPMAERAALLSEKLRLHLSAKN